MILNKQALYFNAYVTELNKSVLFAVKFMQDLIYLSDCIINIYLSRTSKLTLRYFNITNLA